MAQLLDRKRSQLLVFRYQQGKQETFYALVEIWEKPLFYFIRRLVRTEDDAWDILQDVWLRVVQNIGRLRNLECFPAWLYQIARNTAFNHFRGKLRMESLSKDCENIPEESGKSPAFTAEDAQAIHWGLEQLSIEHCEALTLHFLEEFSLNEISSITGASVGTVKSRLH